MLPLRRLHTTPAVRSLPKYKDVSSLLSAFKDPSSPFHLAPGERGPSDAEFPLPDFEHSTPAPQPGPEVYGTGATAPYAASRKDALALVEREGWDEGSVLEWPVAWGEQDTYQHVNNVSYVRYLEHARLHFIATLSKQLPKEKVEDMLQGKRTGIILKSIKVDYKRPLTYPDSILFLSRPHTLLPSRAQWSLTTHIYSLAQNVVVCKGESVHVMYDYDKFKRGVMTPEVLEAFRARGGDVAE